MRIGGGGERKTLRLVARYADACNLFASSPEDVAHKLDVLRRHCDDVGRDYDAIDRTILYVGPALATGDVDGFLRDMDAYARLGVHEVDVMPPPGETDRWIADTLGPVVPLLAELG